MLVLPTVEDTRAFGIALASLLRPGDLVILSGPLGAGKTAMAQGVGAGLGVRGTVTSPTFVIARVHPPVRSGSPALVHVDAYRFGAVADPRAEIDDLDLDASVDDSVTLVEWGEGMVEQLADSHLEVRIDRRDDESRVIELVGHGGDWAARLDAAALTTGTPSAEGAAPEAPTKPADARPAAGAATKPAEDPAAAAPRAGRAARAGSAEVPG
jgi:tRNA threonylcarbamoyladenosine biosynthesis protein TsaE